MPGSGSNTTSYGSLGTSQLAFHFFTSTGTFVFDASLASYNQKNNVQVVILGGGGASNGYGGGGGAAYSGLSLSGQGYINQTGTTSVVVSNIGRGYDAAEAYEDGGNLAVAKHATSTRVTLPDGKVYFGPAGGSGLGNNFDPGFHPVNTDPSNVATFTDVSDGNKQYYSEGVSGAGGGGIGTTTVSSRGVSGSTTAGGGGRGRIGQGYNYGQEATSASGGTPGAGAGCFGPAPDTSPNDHPIKYMICGGAGGKNTAGSCGSVPTGANACGSNPRANSGSGANGDIPRSGASGVVVFFYPTS